MKNYIFLGLFILFPFLLIGQQNLQNAEVTVLMKNNSKLTGIVKMDFTHSLHLKIDDETYVLKKKDILIVVPGEAMLENWKDKVLKKDLIVTWKKVWLSVDIIEIGDKSVQFMMDSSRHILPMTEVSKIYPKGQKLSFVSGAQSDKDYSKPVKNSRLNLQIEKEGFYHIFYGNLATKNGIFESPAIATNGYGIQYVLGYQISQRTGFGIGVGYLDYLGLDGEGRPKLVPMFVEARGYLSKKKISAYYNLAVGVTTGIDYVSNNPNTVKPGLYTHPALGYKFGSDNVAFLVDFGVQLSKLRYEFDLSDTFPIGEDTVDFFEIRRLVLRLGIMF